MREMTDRETAEHLREYVKHQHGTFSWATDGCGYRQHSRFVEHRNSNWCGGSVQEFNQFILDYADTLDPPKGK